MSEETDMRVGASGRSYHRRYSLRASLVGLVAACLLPAALIAAGLVYANYRLERDRVYRDTLLSARYLAADLDRELTAIETGLRVLATSPALVAGDLDSFHKQAAEALKGQIVNNYVLTDRQGRQLLNTIVPYGTPLPSAGRPIQLRRVFESGAVVLTDLFVGPVTRAPIAALGIPIYRHGEVAYSLSIGIAPDRIQRVLQRRSLPDGWVASVLDSAGTIVARTRESQRFVGKKAVQQMVRQLTIGQEGTIETHSMEGIDMVSSLSRSSASNWSVAVGAPKAALEAQLYSLIAWVGLGLFAVVAMGLWLATRLAGRVTSAVRGLNDAALALGNGEPVELPKTRLAEADAVADALLQAARILEHTTYLAQHDALTKLGNRSFFYDTLERSLAIAMRGSRPLAVLAIDLDDFKTVNDRYGHLAGDRVLKVVGDRIAHTVRSSDLAARLGGDEFAILLSDADADSARELAERLVEVLSQPYESNVLPISASIGIAIFPKDGTSGVDLLAHADRALYEAKRLGKRRVVMEI